MIALAALVVVAFAAVAGGAFAGDSPQRPKPVAKPARPLSSAGVEQLIARFADLPQAIAKSAAKRKKKRAPKSVTYGAAADGSDLYYVVLEDPAALDGDEDARTIRSPIRVMRRDRASGAETTVFNASSSIVLGIQANNGHIAISTVRFAPYRRTGSELTTSVLIGDRGSASLTVADQRTIRFDPKGDKICGEFGLLSALSSSGEALVTRFGVKCARIPRIVSSIEGVRALDNHRTLLPAAPLDSDSFVLDLIGDKLLTGNPYESALAVADVSTGSFENYWSPGADAAAIAEDGSVAVIGDVAEDLDWLLGEPVTSPPPPATNVAPSRQPRFPAPQPARPQHPFVVFPGGDANKPVIVAKSAGKIEKLKFCGGNLYTLKPLRGRNGLSYSPFDGLLDTGTFSARYSVARYTVAGGFVGKLADTRSGAISDVGCAGDRLLLAGVSSNKPYSEEIGP